MQAVVAAMPRVPDSAEKIDLPRIAIFDDAGVFPALLQGPLC
jgi:hypothetical protein